MHIQQSKLSILKKASLATLPMLAVAAVVASSGASYAAKPATAGFDEFGYNYQARIFVGSADGSDRTLDGTVWGDPMYANDHLVMKWSKAWDDARFNGAAWSPDAWVTNEWNGMAPDGSQTTEHVKIVWVGPELENSPYWRDGGYAIWGQFEAISDQGMDATGHWVSAHAVPNGLGAYKQ